MKKVREATKKLSNENSDEQKMQQKILLNVSNDKKIGVRTVARRD